jgi:hypothetical protein
MDIHMNKIGDDLAALNVDMAVVKADYVTRADLAEVKHSIVKWIVSAILLAQLLPPILRKFGI